MTSPEFDPGFRISLFDVLVLCIGLPGAFVAGTQLWWAGWVPGFVVLHFFLFCNVFRISRSAELIWAAAFLALATSTIHNGVPGWTATFAGSIALSALLIRIETKRENYHGVFWEKLNPNLPTWWKSNR